MPSGQMAGVVHEHVDAAVPHFRRALDGGRDLLTVGPIDMLEFRRPAAGAYCALHGYTRVIVNVGDEHNRASSAKRSAMARPMPCAAPVTIAVLPLSRISASFNIDVPTAGRKRRSIARELMLSRPRLATYRTSVRRACFLSPGQIRRPADCNRMIVPADAGPLAAWRNPPNLVRRVAGHIQISRFIKR